MVKPSWCGFLALLVGLIGSACADDDSGGESQASSESAGCQPGQEGCPCAQGNACVVGLMCVSNACIDPGALSGGTSGGSSDGSGGSASGTTSGGASSSSGAGSTSTSTSTSGTSGPSGCSSNDACPDDSICIADECTWIGDLYFDVTVHAFEPPDCLDGWGDAEIYYDYYEGGELISSSSIAGCPGAWPDEVLFYDSLKAFKLEFWDSDAFSDDLITSLCWGGDPCTEIPFSILKEGWWSGLDATATYYLALSFDPVLP